MVILLISSAVGADCSQLHRSGSGEGAGGAGMGGLWESELLFVIVIQNALVVPAALMAARRNGAGIVLILIACPLFIKWFPSRRGGGYRISRLDPTEAQHKNSLAKLCRLRRPFSESQPPRGGPRLEGILDWISRVGL